MDFIICGDFHVNFLIDSNSAQLLTLFLQSYNLIHVIDFPPRTTEVFSSAVDNFFIDCSRINSFKAFSLINGLSDHKAYYLCVNNISDRQTDNFRLVKKRLITISAVSMFIEMLKNESWDNIINHTDVNESFNLLLNTFLITFESCFPVQYVTNKVSNNHWVTTGIKVSCKSKKYFYIMSKTSNCSKIKVCYIQYFRVLRKGWTVGSRGKDGGQRKGKETYPIRLKHGHGARGWGEKGGTETNGVTLKCSVS